MTVIREAPKGKMLWHEALEDARGSNASKVLAIMHLSIKEDYVYGMARQFKTLLTKKNGWDEDRIKKYKVKALLNQTGLQPLIADLEKRGFLVPRDDKVDGRKRKYFSLNPEILRSPDGAENYFIPVHHKKITQKIENTDIDFEITDIDFSIAEDLIEDFLKRLRTVDIEQNLRDLISIKDFDFVTFLLFAKQYAEDFNMPELAGKLERYISEIERLKRDRRCINAVSSKFHSLKAKFKEDAIDSYIDGIKYYGNGEYEEAIKAYDKAIELDPKYPAPQEGKERALNALQKDHGQNQLR